MNKNTTGLVRPEALLVCPTDACGEMKRAYTRPELVLLVDPPIDGGNYNTIAENTAQNAGLWS